MRVVLSAVDFRDLVRGKVIDKHSILDGNQLSPPIEICLADIGFANMRDILEEAIDDRWRSKPGNIPHELLFPEDQKPEAQKPLDRGNS